MSETDSRPSSAKAGKSPGQKPAAKLKKGKVTIEDTGESAEAIKIAELEKQVAELQQALRTSEDKLAARDREMNAMGAETEGSREKVADAFRNSARRLVQIHSLENELEEYKRKQAVLENELMKHTMMMDSVMNFRDKESSREYHELLHENAELADKCARWKERAQLLQQERWSFVQKWRAEKIAATEAGTSIKRPDVPQMLDSDEEGSEVEEEVEPAASDEEDDGW